MVKFDTRFKKPKVWNIAVLSGIVIVCVAILVLVPKEIPFTLISILIGVYIVLVIVLLIIALFRQMEYNLYSYNTIYYIAFSLFLLTVLISYVRGIVAVTGIGVSVSLNMIFMMLSGSATDFMFITSPVVIVFSAALFVSNVFLIRRAGFRFQNVLGMLLAFLMVGGEVVLFFADQYATGSAEKVLVRTILVRLFAAIYLYCECMVAGSVIAALVAAKYEPEKDKDYLLILGCGLNKDGTPGAVLQGRIDRAIEFYRKQIDMTGKAPLLIPSGGKGSDEINSEGEAMETYLLEKGIPAEHIRKEDRSTTTFENMVFSKKIIDEIDPNGKIAFSTTNYHVFRSGIMARRVKMRALGMGAKAKWYFWPNAAVREFAAILAQHRLKQVLILGSMIIVYVLLTIGAFKIPI